MNSSNGNNPLLQIQFQIPFDRIRAEHVEPAIAELLHDARQRLSAVASDTEDATFENTMTPFEDITERLDYAMGIVKHLESVATSPELRAAYNAVQPEVSAFSSSIPMHEGLWKTIQRYASTPGAKELTGVRRRYLKKTMDAFRRHGAELDPAGKARLSEIDVELARLTTRFSENVLDSTNSFELTIEDFETLAGLPPSAITAARESAHAKGISGWRFTLQAPSYLALTTYLDNAPIRERVYRAYSSRASGADFDKTDLNNRGILDGILKLRREKAQLLGFRDFADLVLDDRMAHSGERALEFLKNLEEKTRPSFERENLELQEFRQQAIELKPWDIAYYAEKQRAALYEFDEEALRPYFPLESVVAGMFSIFGRVFGIRVTEESGVPVWNPQVKYYTIHDERSGILLGAFYADFFPRDNKRGGAWMDALITGLPTTEGLRPHAGLICGNLTPPSGGQPALLTHREVETIFHEFGHLLHHCLSQVEVRSLAGTNVPWDFVELPSQIMENWCWERASLDLFARHFKTGELIPDELFLKMKRARTFRGANAQMRQLAFGLADLDLHRNYSPEAGGDLIEYTRNFLQNFFPAKLPPEYAMMASFTHLFGSPVGYGAGYYSYKWAEVLDADAFTRFKQEGILDREIGMQFRENILAKGDSEDPADLYRSFMGRDPDLNPLLERSGLTR